MQSDLRRRPFPWASCVANLVIALPASAIALVFVGIALNYFGDKYDIDLVEVGGWTFDTLANTLVLVAFATVFGGIGVICGRRALAAVSEWRT